MCLNILLYGLPLIPLLTRTLLSLAFWRELPQILPELENDREAHRSIILPLMGFSFSGLVALTIVDATIKINLDYPVFYVMISFLSYFFALNLQGYKYRRWHDQLSSALLEIGSLCLMLCVAAILFGGQGVTGFTTSISALALAVWSLDHIIRLYNMQQHLKQIGDERRLQTQSVRQAPQEKEQ